MATDTQLRPTEKQEVSSGGEQTREGVLYQPAVDIFEREDSLTLLADMPGVTPDKLTIDLRENVLSIRGDVLSPEGQAEAVVDREFEWGGYYRQFTLADSIDQAKIEASLDNGVLRLQLPKVEKAKPRQITVKTS